MVISFLVIGHTVQQQQLRSANRVADFDDYFFNLIFVKNPANDSDGLRFFGLRPRVLSSVREQDVARWTTETWYPSDRSSVNSYVHHITCTITHSVMYL